MLASRGFQPFLRPLFSSSETISTIGFGGIHKRGVVGGIEPIGFRSGIEESNTDVVVAFACCPHKRCVGLVECVGVCCRDQERLDSVEIVTEDGAAEKGCVDRVCLHEKTGVEEDFREAIGREISDFGEE